MKKKIKFNFFLLKNNEKITNKQTNKHKKGGGGKLSNWYDGGKSKSECYQKGTICKKGC